MEGRKIRQRPGQQAKIVRHLQQAHKALQNQARDQVKGLGQGIKGGIRRSVFHLLDFLIETAVYGLRRVGGIKRHLDDRVWRFVGHLFLNGHIDLDLPVPAVDLLAGDKAVQPRISGAGPDIGGQQHMEDAEALHASPALFHDVALDIGNLDMVLDEVLGGIPGLHDVRGHGEDGRQRPQPPPVHAVAEAADIGPLLQRPLLHSHAQQQHGGHTQQNRDLRQPVMQGPSGFLPVLYQNMVCHGQAEQKPQRHLGGHPSRHRGGVQHRHQRIQQQAQHRMEPGGKPQSLDSEKHAAHPDRDGRPVQPLPAVCQGSQRKQQVCRDGQEDLEPKCRAGDRVLPAGPDNAHHCRTNHTQRRQDHQGVDPWDPIDSFLFHSSIILPCFDCFAMKKPAKKRSVFWKRNAFLDVLSP